MLLFHLKSSFRPRDIQIFFFLFFPHLFPVGRNDRLGKDEGKIERG